MKRLMTSSLAALAVALLAAGCAVTPVGGPYYGYGYYDRPYVYGYGGPVYYDTPPGYYYGAPAVVGTFHYGSGSHDHHWGGSSWHHESLTGHSGRTHSHAFRAAHSAPARAATHASRHPMRGESDKS